MGKAPTQKLVLRLMRAKNYELAAEVLLRVMEPTGPVTDSPSRIWELLKPYAARRKENFIVVMLNHRNTVIGHEIISVGLINETLVHPREIFRPAIANLSSSIILAHNHPSGSLVPSREDVDVTRRLIEAGKLLGIKVLDHLIISPRSYYSMGTEDEHAGMFR